MMPSFRPFAPCHSLLRGSPWRSVVKKEVAVERNAGRGTLLRPTQNPEAPSQGDSGRAPSYNEAMAFSPRYARQVAFPQIGEAGQARLLAASAVVVGAGAVGAAVADQLARSGVGRLKIVDRDVLEESNLGRQALYTADDAGRRLPKAIALAARLRAINPEIAIEPVAADLGPANAAAILGGASVILDGTDNLETRYLLNDFAVREGVPWIYGGCVGSRGITAAILPGETACLRCIYPDPPGAGTLETCETAGIVAPAANLIASLEVVEALKILVGDRARVRRTWISVELWPFRMIEVGGTSSGPRPDCACCGTRSFPFLEARGAAVATALCGRDAVHVAPARASRTDLDQLAARLERLGHVRRHEYVLVFSAGAHEITVFEDGRALVKGTSDPAAARSLYDRYVGS
jgi:molybdopterin-synthase adenylyltransferase